MIIQLLAPNAHRKLEKIRNQFFVFFLCSNWIEAYCIAESRTIAFKSCCQWNNSESIFKWTEIIEIIWKLQQQNAPETVH